MTLRRRRKAGGLLGSALPALLAVIGLVADGAHATCHDDRDGDGVPDPYDNCLEVPNPDQVDTNLDGLGNACDADYNGDGAVTTLDLPSFIASFTGAAPTPDTDHNGDGATTTLDFSTLMALFVGALSAESGLACVTGPAGGPIPCTFESYDEIVETSLVSATPIGTREAPAEGDLTSVDELFVFQSPGHEVLAGAETVDYAADGLYDVTTPFTPESIAAGEVVSRWVFHSEASVPGDPALPTAASVEFAASEEVLGVRLVGSAAGSALAFDGGDVIGLAGQTVTLEVPTPGLQVEVLTRCAPEPLAGVSFSIDLASASMGAAASFPAGAMLQAHDLLTVGDPGAPGPNPTTSATPISPPGQLVEGFFLTGLANGELDALSYGREQGRALWFSVDRFSFGTISGVAPDVLSEALGGSNEASADVFAWNGALPGAAVGIAGNTALWDGDGVVPFGGAGFGLDERQNALGQYRGDDLDALDGDTEPEHLAGPVFFSLDAASAAAGFGGSGGDIFARDEDGETWTYLYAGQLGLSFGDDIDALALREDDLVGLQFDPTVDRLLFSLRRGSASIGVLDCRFGLPIEPSDVLSPPCVAGGPPGIAVRAADLGLRAMRDGHLEADELDALDRVPEQALTGGGNPGGDPDPS